MQQLRKPVMESPQMVIVSGSTISCPPATSATAHIPPAGSIQPWGCDKDTAASSEPDRTTGKLDLRLLSGRAGSLEFPKGKGAFRRRCMSIALYKWNVSPTISIVLLCAVTWKSAGAEASGLLTCCLIFYIGLQWSFVCSHCCSLLWALMPCCDSWVVRISSELCITTHVYRNVRGIDSFDMRPVLCHRTDCVTTGDGPCQAVTAGLRFIPAEAYQGVFPATWENGGNVWMEI
jgi:hypothetical protein